jgi:hypothetical protein
MYHSLHPRHARAALSSFLMTLLSLSSPALHGSRRHCAFWLIKRIQAALCFGHTVCRRGCRRRRAQKQDREEPSALGLSRSSLSSRESRTWSRTLCTCPGRPLWCVPPSPRPLYLTESHIEGQCAPSTPCARNLRGYRYHIRVSRCERAPDTRAHCAAPHVDHKAPFVCHAEPMPSV